MELANLLASEEACGLKYHPAAIKAFIEKNVPDDSMRFTSMLSLLTSGVNSDVKKMSASQLVAHCTQIIRVAKKVGFID